MSKLQSILYQNSQYSRVMNLKYKSKYKKIKRQLKSFVFENAGLCDEVAHVQADLSVAREERRFLIKRLMRHEGLEALRDSPNVVNKSMAVSEKSKISPAPKKRGPKKRIQHAANHINGSSAKIDDSKSKCSQQTIVLDASGKPIYPITLASTLMLHMPGEILSKNTNFHTRNWIYPVGYVATRIYAHPKDPHRKCVFTCKILNNAGMPQFQLIPDNDFDSVFFGETANHCHQELLEALQRTTSVTQLPMRKQGERFFGLGNSTVMSIMQSDPNYQHCTHFKGFLVDGGYANEDKDPTLNFDALQSFISISTYHTVPEVKDEPPDELLE